MAFSNVLKVYIGLATLFLTMQFREVEVAEHDSISSAISEIAEAGVEENDNISSAIADISSEIADLSKSFDAMDGEKFINKIHKYVVKGGIVPTRRPKETSICSTAACKVAGAFFKSAMNMNANPCENFYEYACGGFLKKNTIPADKGSWGQYDILIREVSSKGIKLLSKPKIRSPKSAVDNARAYFQSCLDLDKSTTKDIPVLREIISHYANIKLLGKKEETRHQWQQQLAKLMKDIGLYKIIGFVVGPDEMDNKKRSIQLIEPIFGLSRETLVHPNKPPEKNRVAAYKKYMRESFCILIGGCKQSSKEKVTNLVDQVFDLESHLANLTDTPEEKRSRSKNYTRATIGELNNIIPDIKWKTFINTIVGAIGLNFGDRKEVIVVGEPYLKKAANYLKNANNDLILSYIAWSMLKLLGPLTTRDFRNHEFKFNKVINGIKKPQSLPERCYDLTNNLMGYAVGNLYVKRHLATEALSEMKSLIKGLHSSMGSMINQNKWMDLATKEKAKQKMKKFRDNIGYPSWILNDRELNNYYKMEPVSRNNFLRSHQRLLKLKRRKYLIELAHPSDPTREWGSNAFPAVVNAFYQPITNSIYFPAGILHPPFFHYNTLKAVNYGAVGFVIGHEITHGFDNQGSQYDGNGNLRNWWTNRTRAEFNKRKECFINLYGNITDKQTKLKLNSKNTIGEDIADNGGIRQAFNAFSKSNAPDKRLPGLTNLTPNQLFFVAAANTGCTKIRPEALRNLILADAHTPPMYRAVIPLSNEENFAKTFNCKLGSKMNPKKKCVLW